MPRLNYPVAGVIHLAAGLVAVAGVVALWLGGRGDVAKQFSLLIYGASLVAQYAASSAYHLINTSAAGLAVLRRLDHAAIFVLIAGSYTPMAFNVLSGGWRWGVLGGIWAIALAGIAFKMATLKTRRWVNVGIYLLMGWLGVFPALQILRLLPLAAFGWLLLEALFYTVGAVIYASKSLDFFPGRFGFHEIWHLFVIAGSLSHFLFVLLYVVPYARLN